MNHFLGSKLAKGSGIVPQKVMNWYSHVITEFVHVCSTVSFLFCNLSMRRTEVPRLPNFTDLCGLTNLQPGSTCRKYSTASSAVLLLHVKMPFLGT